MKYQLRGAVAGVFGGREAVNCFDFRESGIFFGFVNGFLGGGGESQLFWLLEGVTEPVFSGRVLRG
jgi:hypothetical protein